MRQFPGIIGSFSHLYGFGTLWLLQAQLLVPLFGGKIPISGNKINTQDVFLCIVFECECELNV